MLGIKRLFGSRQKATDAANRFQPDGMTEFRKQLKSFKHLKSAKRYQQYAIKLLGSDFAVADGMSFYYSFEEIFVNQIYKFKCQTNTPRIIDCGANYGTSVAYFKQLYPDSHVVAVEADPSVFNLLQGNMNSLEVSQLELIHAAVSGVKGFVRFRSEGADSGRIDQDANSEQSTKIRTIQLDELIGNSHIDFLKMDIEGAETEAIAGSERLNQVDQLFIEYHSFRNQPQTLTILLEKLTTAGFRYYIHSQFCSPRPLVESRDYLGMDLQLNIFGLRNEASCLKQAG